MVIISNVDTVTVQFKQKIKFTLGPKISKLSITLTVSGYVLRHLVLVTLSILVYVYALYHMQSQVTIFQT